MTQRAYDFEREIGAARSNLVAEFWGFLKQNKKWWLLPIIMVFMLVGMLLVLGGTAAAPFIYTLF
jgi:hypothetical protein